MDKFMDEMAEILEVDAVEPADALEDFESWDSLAALSVAALADDEFGVTMTSQEINEASTIEDLYQRIQAKRSS